LRSLDEVAAYRHCHGDRSDNVIVGKAFKPAVPVLRIPRGRSRVSGEQLRRCFEERLDARQQPPASVTVNATRYDL
jgi:hypothetical protein